MTLANPDRKRATCPWCRSTSIPLDNCRHAWHEREPRDLYAHLAVRTCAECGHLSDEHSGYSFEECHRVGCGCMLTPSGVIAPNSRAPIEAKVLGGTTNPDRTTAELERDLAIEQLRLDRETYEREIARLRSQLDAIRARLAEEPCQSCWHPKARHLPSACSTPDRRILGTMCGCPRWDPFPVVEDLLEMLDRTVA